jgi:hypothetical protein
VVGSQSRTSDAVCLQISLRLSLRSPTRLVQHSRGMPIRSFSFRAEACSHGAHLSILSDPDITLLRTAGDTEGWRHTRMTGMPQHGILHVLRSGLATHFARRFRGMDSLSATEETFHGSTRTSRDQWSNRC